MRYDPRLVCVWWYKRDFLNFLLFVIIELYVKANESLFIYKKNVLHKRIDGVLMGKANLKNAYEDYRCNELVEIQTLLQNHTLG